MACDASTFAFDRRHCVEALAVLTLYGLSGRVGVAAERLGRLAAVDWAAAESLLAVGVVPLAVSETSVFRQWLPECVLPESVVDLGSRNEPNLELLAALKPDRIFLSNWQRSLSASFQRIAPTEIVTIIDARREAYQNARMALAQIAERAGNAGAAEIYLDAFDRALKTYTRQLEPHAGSPLYIGVLHESGSQIFVYGNGSWVGDILNQLGLRNALKRPTSAFGNAFIDIAYLAETPGARLFYLDQGERTRRAERRLRSSTLWRNLPMTRAGRVHRIPAFYPLGGMPSVWRFARLLTQALVQASEGAHG